MARDTRFREFSGSRDAGSPEVQPIYKDGRTVRFTNDPHAASGFADCLSGP